MKAKPCVGDSNCRAGAGLWAQRMVLAGLAVRLISDGDIGLHVQLDIPPLTGTGAFSLARASVSPKCGSANKATSAAVRLGHTRAKTTTDELCHGVVRAAGPQLEFVAHRRSHS